MNTATATTGIDSQTGGGAASAVIRFGSVDHPCTGFAAGGLPTRAGHCSTFLFHITAEEVVAGACPLRCIPRCHGHCYLNAADRDEETPFADCIVAMGCRVCRWDRLAGLFVRSLVGRRCAGRWVRNWVVFCGY